jgi:hypothetical protein
MHFLRLFLMAWLVLEIVSPFFLFWLFWLNKRTAETAKEPGKLFSPQRSDFGMNNRAA